MDTDTKLVIGIGTLAVLAVLGYLVVKVNAKPVAVAPVTPAAPTPRVPQEIIYMSAGSRPQQLGPATPIDWTTFLTPNSTYVQPNRVIIGDNP